MTSDITTEPPGSASFEPLHPELARFSRPDPTGVLGMVIQHPLLHALACAAPLHAIYNRLYAGKLARLDRALAESNWHSFVWTHERPWRARALVDLLERHAIEPTEYWDLVAEIHVDSENLAQDPAMWRALWSGAPTEGVNYGSARASRELVMQDREREVFAGLPERVRIFRGCGPDEIEGDFCWSTSAKTALWFARRFQRGDEPRLLAEGEIDRERVLAHLLRRGESEIVAFPEDVTVLGTRPVRARSNAPG